MKQVFFFLSFLSVATICNAQANTKLSNLVAPTKVNVNLIPGGTTGTLDLGNNTKKWRNGYFNSTVYGYGVGSSYGVYGTAASYGVYGNSSSGYGVAGVSGFLGVYGSGSTYGVYGAGGTYGVYANGSSYGVYSSSSSGYGVAGVSTNNYGLYGSGYDGSVAYGSYIGAYGSGSSYGVYGYGAIGVYGYTDGGTDHYGVYGYNAGVGYGVRAYCYSGSGIYASSTNNYAGYFAGNVYSTGTYQGSDEKLKQNIRDFSSAMDIINKLHPKQYEFRHDGDYQYMNLPTVSQYGLIANDVEKVLPNLVRETQFDPNMAKLEKPVNPADKKAVEAQSAKSQIINFKALNYTEFIPIMIKAMQELSKQNDDLKTQVATLTQTVSQLSKSNGTISANSASINQNFPNPFTKSTVISFNVPQGSNANLVVSQTGSGKVMKTIALSSGSSQLNFDGASLAAGSYTYSLVIDGKKVDSKQMIISR